ncbi:MAG: hypothetical protein KBA55_12865 [Ruminococcus sp.]|nr:hypothetical protein [Ruminococcus sp.]
MASRDEMHQMVQIINKYVRTITKNGSYDYSVFPDITQKHKEKAIKHYDNYISSHNMLAFIDETLFHGGKQGLVLMADGFYYRGIMEKPRFFPYSDVSAIRVKPSKLVDLEINCYSSGFFTTQTVLDADAVRDVIMELIQFSTSIGIKSKLAAGKVDAKKPKLSERELKKCHAIIHSASVAAGGVGTGLAQLPGSDNIALFPIQVGMIIALGSVFDINIVESTAKGIIRNFSAAIAGRTISQVLVGWFPVIGNAINTAAAAGLTEAIGWMAVKNFSKRRKEDKLKGKFEGMERGYEEASEEYEAKLKSQAEHFLRQKKIYEQERDEYERLLDEYEAYITTLELANSSKTIQYRKRYQDLCDLDA